MLGVYLINLATAGERLSAVTGRLTALGLSARRIEAVDGRRRTAGDPAFSPLGAALLHGRRFHGPELGCTLSHHAACAQALADGVDLALILEDDVAFDPDTLAAIDAAAVVGGWDLLRLSSVNRGRRWRRADLGGGRSLAVPLTREKGAGAYVVTPRAARWITRPRRVALPYDIAFDLEFLAGLRAAFVTPPPVRQNITADTQIQSGVTASKLPRWRYLTVLPVRAGMELARLVLRPLLAIWPQSEPR